METKEQAKHTPGPWKLIEGRPEQDYAIFGNVGGYGHGHIADVSKGHIAGEFEANARLIAAAPDLLEAAKEASDKLDVLYRRFSGQENAEKLGTLIRLRAAIAKAEGKR